MAMIRMLIPALVLLVLSLVSTQIFAQDVTLGPDGLPDKQTQEVINTQTAARVDKIYAEEGGKRDKYTIGIECIAHDMVNGLGMNVKSNFDQKDYEGVHTFVDIMENQLSAFKSKAPTIQINHEIMAYVHYLDGESYISEEKYSEAETAYEKSISYKEQGLPHLMLGKLCFSRNDIANGKRHMDLALKLDSKLKPDIDAKIKIMKQRGLM